MDIYIEDFVNREEALTAIWNSVTSAAKERVWLIAGDTGIGKSYLLDECWARGRAQRLLCLRFDLHDARLRTVPALIMQLAEQLGAARAAHTLAAAEQATALAQPAGTGAPSDSSDVIAAQIDGIAQGSLVAVGKGITQISGHVVTYVTQHVRYDDPWVQQQMRLRLTQALRTDLAALQPLETALLLIDGWSAANSEVREWLCSQLLEWVAAGETPQVCAAVAETDSLPDIAFPGRVGRMTLHALAASAVEEYWVKRRKLPAVELSGAYKFSGGVPLVLALIADQFARRIGGPADQGFVG
jgi:hypothetical protein